MRSRPFVGAGIPVDHENGGLIGRAVVGTGGIHRKSQSFLQSIIFSLVLRKK